MKNTSFFSSLFLALTFLSACTPEDQNLHRPNNFTEQGGPANGLRVGSYGQPIWAVQNIEQIGVLIQNCLQSSKTRVENSADLKTKSCRLKLNGDVASAAKLSESWKLDLTLKDEAGILKVVNAEGQLVQNLSTAKFKNISAYVIYQNKSFSFNLDDNNQFEIELSSNGDIGSDTETIPFIHQIDAEGTIDTTNWNFSKLDHQLVLLKRNQSFTVSSNSLKLNWVNATCAEPTGMTLATEVGKASASILLAPNEANQVVTTGRKGWSQKFMGCQDRAKPVLNFEFLFF
jgi:hypothetical protein